MKKTIQHISSIKEIQLFENRRSWETKSGGKLRIIFALPSPVLQSEFLHYTPGELSGLSVDIRGLRLYSVSDLPKKKMGGNEWHRIRQEVISVTDGKVKWTCEDLFGEQMEYLLEPGVSLWMPSLILHRYEAQEERNKFLVLANTLFLPDNPATHDTYRAEMFREFQKKYKK